MAVSSEKKAAVLLIGNELLTGKIADENLQFFARELFDLGIELHRAVFCQDDIETIGNEIKALRYGHDIVFTTGGVGPTHDDVTPEGLAKAVGQPLVESEAVIKIVRARFGEPLNEGHRRLALMPRGAELVSSADAPWPTVCINDIYMFPGVPKIVRAKWAPVRQRLQALQRPPRISCTAYLSIDEFSVAAALRTVAETHPQVVIGSYLANNQQGYHTKLTFDGTDLDAVQKARTAILALLDPEALVRTED